MKTIGLLSLVVGALAHSGCNKPEPHEIKLDHADIVAYDKAATSTDARVVDQDGKVMNEVSITYSAVPTNIASVGIDGRVQCAHSGDATITVAGGGLTSVLTLRCRLAAGIAAPRSLRLVLGEPGQALTPTASTEDGTVIEGAPIQISSSDESIAAVNGGALVPKSIGRVGVRFSLGDAHADASVEVVARVQTTALALSDGGSQVITLERGTYEVEITAVASGGHGVTAQWVGAPCLGAEESQHHRLRCQVAETATLRIENPTVLGLGDMAAGHIVVYRAAE